MKPKTEPKVEEPTESTGINDHEEFRIAFARAQMEGIDSLEISEKLFHKIKPAGGETPYFTMGHPGVKIYRIGTKEAQDKLDGMKAEEYLNYLGKLRVQADI